MTATTIENTTKPASKPKAARQTGFPEFLQDVPKVKEVEIIDTEKLASQLTKTTEYIRKEVGNVAKSFCRIGFKLWEAREQKQYLGQDYKNVYEYANHALGFKKASTANYIAVCERFSVHKDGKPTSQLLPNFASFSYTQLSEMLPLPDEKLADITPDATCKQIREIKNAAKGSANASDDHGEQTTLEDQDDNNGDQDKDGVFVSVNDLIFNQEFTGVNANIIHDALFKYIGYEIKVYVKVGRNLYK